jgi:dCTP diphosphatase
MKKTEKNIKKYLSERGWDKLRPADLAKSISIEAGELLELFQWQNLSLEEVKGNKEKVEAIKKELADVLIYSFDMAVLLGIDTKKIIEDKLDHVKKKYPANIFKARSKNAEPGNEDIYWKIKKEYRKKGL